ncbi:MAG: hypothetical protein ACJ8F3_07245 [Xanthobacteraceae bacterium]
MMQGQLDWLEIARLGVAALTPIMTLVVGILVVHLGTRLDATKQLHAELLRKRLALFEEIAPKVNDIHCFFLAVGHWAELSPEEVIRRKRAIDRAIQVNRYLFRSEFWEAYQRFEQAHFEMFATVGQPAKLRIDMNYMRARLGDHFKSEWLPAVSSSKTGDHEDQRRLYQELMTVLGNEIRGA